MSLRKVLSSTVAVAGVGAYVVSLATTALVASLLANDQAIAGCIPDPATAGDTVVCSGVDTDGFFSPPAASPVEVIIEEGAMISGGSDPNAAGVKSGVISLNGPLQTITNSGTLLFSNVGGPFGSLLGVEAFIDNPGGVPTSFTFTNTATGVIGGAVSGVVNPFSNSPDLVAGVVLDVNRPDSMFDDVKIINHGLVDATDLAFQLGGSGVGTANFLNTGIARLTTTPGIFGGDTSTVLLAGNGSFDLVNSGLIENPQEPPGQGNAAVDFLTNGTVINSGTIIGRDTAVRVDSPDNTVAVTITNQAGGVITGDSDGDGRGSAILGAIAKSATAAGFSAGGRVAVINEAGGEINTGGIGGSAIALATRDDFQVTATATPFSPPGNNVTVTGLTIPGVVGVVAPQLMTDALGQLVPVLDANGNPIYPATVESAFGTLTLISNADGSVDVVGADSSPVFGVPADSATRFADSVDNAGHISGKVQLGLGNDQFIVRDQGTVDGLTDGGSGTDALIADIASGSNTISGTQFINFESFEKLGAGTLNLTDTLTVDSARVTSGLLTQMVGSQIVASSGVTVGAGGTLSGAIDIVGNLTVDAGGTVSPGFSPGDAIITGNLDLTGGGILDIQIGGMGSGMFDRFLVGGNLLLDGGEIHLTLIDGVTLNDLMGFGDGLASFFFGLDTMTGLAGPQLTDLAMFTNTSFMLFTPGMAFDLLFGNGFGSFQGIQLTERTAVPEPWTLLLFIFGLLAIGVAQRRRARAKTSSRTAA